MGYSAGRRSTRTTEAHLIIFRKKSDLVEYRKSPIRRMNSVWATSQWIQCRKDHS
jgi:hypothetical protein